MSPHIWESVIGAVIAGVPMLIVALLQKRDLSTRLVVKVEQHEEEITGLQADVKDHAERLVRVETTVASR